jgi:hypothetical protein
MNTDEKCEYIREKTGIKVRPITKQELEHYQEVVEEVLSDD